MSEPMKVHEAITAVMTKVRAVGKDQQNQQQGFNFRGIDATVNALSPVMREVGLTVRPVLVSKERGHATTNRGGTMNTVEVVVDYVFTGPGGDSITARTPGEAFDNGDKATAKAMSVAFRTALLQTFALPTQDSDPDEETYSAQQHPGRQQAQPQQQARPQQKRQPQPQQEQPADPAQKAWESLKKAEGDLSKLQALRQWVSGAQAPDAFKQEFHAAVEQKIQEATPVEGAVQ